MHKHSSLSYKHEFARSSEKSIPMPKHKHFQSIRLLYIMNRHAKVISTTLNPSIQPFLFLEGTYQRTFSSPMFLDQEIINKMDKPDAISIQHSILRINYNDNWIISI